MVQVDQVAAVDQVDLAAAVDQVDQAEAAVPQDQVDLEDKEVLEVLMVIVDLEVMLVQDQTLEDGII